MKVKTILLILVLGLLFVSSSGLATDVTLEWGTLWAGQFYYAGEFKVFNTGTGLRIEIFPISSWKITESHVAIGKNICDIPQTGNSCNGNPIPGQFPYGQYSLPTTVPHVYNITFAELGLTPGIHSLYFAIHAVLVKLDAYGCIIQDETAWGGPCGNKWSPSIPLPFSYYRYGQIVTYDKLGKNRWGYYFILPVNVPVSVPTN